MKNILKISSIIIVLWLFSGCVNTRKDENTTPEDHTEMSISNFITMSKDQLEVMNIKLGKVKKMNTGNSLKVNGQLELPPQNRAGISALLGGRVRSVAVIEGDFVKKGHLLARLENPEFIALQQKYLSLKGNLSFLENDYKRKKSLAADGITSQKSLQRAQADYLKGKADLNAVKSTLSILNVNLKSLDKGDLATTIAIISPIKGFVQNIRINIGKYISPQQEMFEIIDNDFIHIGLNVFEKDIDKAQNGQKVTFALTTRPDKIYHAEIFSVGKAFEMDTRSVKVHAKIIGDHQGLLPGMFVEARILTSYKINDVLPNEAFISEKGLDYIFVQKEDHSDKIIFEKIQVKKGISDLQYSRVSFLQPLSPERKIVVKGAFYINAEMNKGAFEEHEH